MTASISGIKSALIVVMVVNTISHFHSQKVNKFKTVPSYFVHLKCNSYIMRIKLNSSVKSSTLAIFFNSALHNFSLIQSGRHFPKKKAAECRQLSWLFCLVLVLSQPGRTATTDTTHISYLKILLDIHLAVREA